MIGCLDNNHDHEDPRAPCVQATHTPGPSRSATERQAVTATPPLNSKTPYTDAFLRFFADGILDESQVLPTGLMRSQLAG